MVDEHQDSIFVGRERDLAWLEERIRFGGRWNTPIVITGLAGVGKTALVRRALSERSRAMPRWRDFASPWFDGFGHPDVAPALDHYIEGLYREGRSAADHFPRLIVVLDNVDELSDAVLKKAVDRLYNMKRVRSVVLATRRTVELPRAEVLRLGALDQPESELLLRSLGLGGLGPEVMAEAVRSALGSPLALSLLARLIGEGGSAALHDLVRGSLYDVSNCVAPFAEDIVTVAGPCIVTAQEALISQLKKFPESIHELAPRRFEELLAELLVGMGWEAELTPQTRDGGKDLLAYLQTDVGRLLCLVEAKKFRADRKVGVDLVRTLYGTLCDYQANSAMLVTTSSFSADARDFQQKHQYQLSLKDYADLVGWIQRHKRTRITV